MHASFFILKEGNCAERTSLEALTWDRELVSSAAVWLWGVGGAWEACCRRCWREGHFWREAVSQPSVTACTPALRGDRPGGLGAKTLSALRGLVFRETPSVCLHRGRLNARLRYSSAGHGDELAVWGLAVEEATGQGQSRGARPAGRTSSDRVAGLVSASRETPRHGIPLQLFAGGLRGPWITEEGGCGSRSRGGGLALGAGIFQDLEGSIHAPALG